MKLFLVFLTMMMHLCDGGISHAQQGVAGNYLRLYPSALPTACHQGDIRYDTVTSTVEVCGTSNAWTYIGYSARETAYTVIGNNTSSSTAAPGPISSILLSTPSYTPAITPALQATKSASGNYNLIVQNTSSNAAAAANVVVQNNNGTGTTYGAVLGMNSSAFTGTGSLSGAGYTYLYGENADLALGTSGSNAIHFVINNGATDAYQINTSGNLVCPAMSSYGALVNNTSGVISSSASTANYPLVGNSGSAPSFQQLNLTSGVTNVLPVANGGTRLSAPQPTPTPTQVVFWDANSSISANNSILGYTSYATAGATTTITSSATYTQNFTGSSNQTFILPAVSALAIGTSYFVTNNSSGIVTVQSSGANTIQAMAAASSMIVTSNVASGTGSSVWNAAYNSGASALVNPMSGVGDIIYGGSSGAATKLVGPTAANTYFLSSTGTGGAAQAPAWSQLVPATFSIATASGTGTGGFGAVQKGYVGSVIGASAASGDTYTNNGVTYTVAATISAASGQVFYLTAPTPTPSPTGTAFVRASGSGTNPVNVSSIQPLYLYTTPTSPKSPIELEVEMCGAGGGGGGSTASGAGSGTLFGLLTLNAAGGGAGTESVGGTGGVLNYNSAPWTLSSIATVIDAFNGTGGQQGSNGAASATVSGGSGANSPLGGAGGGGANPGGSAIANSCSGGGGLGSLTSATGGGGGSGAYIKFILTGANIPVTYYYSVGVGGTAGTGGGVGGSGRINVKEIYQ